MWLQNQRFMQCKPSSLFAVRYIRTKQNQQCPIGKKTMKKILKLNYRRNMTQQKQFFKAAVWLVSAILLTACTHDGDLDGGNHQAHERLQFNLSFAQFNADKEAVNGAKAKVRAVSAPQTIDLGNGLELEMTAERDDPEPPTRTTPLYDGHYTILAINNAGNRVGKIKGTVTSGNFTRDEDEQLDLFDGQQYTFVCFNSSVTDDGTNLKFDDLNLHPAEQDMPLIGRVTWTVHPGQNFIPFEMKRQVGRVRFKLTTYTADAQNAKINLTTVHWHNRKAMYNPGTKAYAGESGAGSGYAPIDENPVYGASGVAYDAMVKAHEQTTPYYYFLGNDVAGAGFIIGDASLQFTSGTAYGKALPTTKYHIGTIFNTNDYFTSNSSYTFTIKVKGKDPLLLFQDGTVGYYGDRTTTRTPIAVVLDEKTTTTDGLAVALKDALPNECIWNDDATTIVNPHAFTNFYAAIADMDGYRWTYESDGSADHIAKADVAVKDGKYNAFYQAIHYNAGVPLTFSGGKTGKWFLPSLGQVHHLVLKIGKGNISAESNPNELGSGLYKIDPLETTFINAGGTFGYQNFWTSTEYSKDAAIIFFPRDYMLSDREVLYFNARKNINEASVRPFIYY